MTDANCRNILLSVQLAIVVNSSPVDKSLRFDWVAWPDADEDAVDGAAAAAAASSGGGDGGVGRDRKTGSTIRWMNGIWCVGVGVRNHTQTHSLSLISAKRKAKFNLHQRDSKWKETKNEKWETKRGI